MRLRQSRLVAACTALVMGGAQAEPDLDFMPATAALGYAVDAYEAIWNEYGDRIVAAFEARTCMPFRESEVAAIVADATSHSGGPDHPMQLRASYAREVKQSTLVHELGHRHLWQLSERLDDVDGHMTLYLVLDRVWSDVWGEDFAAQRIRGESRWETRYDYGKAWRWARSLGARERARLWNRLLAMNGFERPCAGLDGGPGSG